MDIQPNAKIKSRAGHLLAAAALSLGSATVHALDFGGYVRIGPGEKQATTGDDKRCFDGHILSGGGHFRLGNECDTYGEFTFTQGAKIGGVEYQAVLMPNFWRPGSDIGGTSLGLAQMYIAAKGFDFAPEQSFWMGKRYYERAAVHMGDFFVVNMTGTGAGVDGIKVGSGALGLAVFRDGDNSTAGANTNPITRFNADLSALKVNPGGTLRITATRTSASGAGGKSGAGISFQHDQAGVLGGTNTLWVQYARGSTGLNMGNGNPTDGTDMKRWRVVDAMTWATGPLTGQLMAVHGNESLSPAVSQSFNSLAGRVAYALTKNFKLQGEAGITMNKPDGAPAQRLTKVTIAPTLTVGPNYYDRPELRFYVTRFSFNDAYRAAEPGLTHKGRTAVGFQAELWF